MPIYEYKCVDCSEKFEVFLKSNDNNQQVCPHCGGYGKKLISNTSFILKGSGWYVTDYASPERKKAMAEEKEGNGSKPSSSDKKVETKVENKAETESKVA
ncbi:MAG: zinc ribbon domain-containing protein [Thermodesulfovibrionales bacterium]|nr:zinc ribbon domain-containing protein [Thermodesulfovibrionales bacterium]